MSEAVDLFAFMDREIDGSWPNDVSSEHSSAIALRYGQFIYECINHQKPEIAALSDAIAFGLSADPNHRERAEQWIDKTGFDPDQLAQVFLDFPGLKKLFDLHRSMKIAKQASGSAPQGKEPPEPRQGIQIPTPIIAAIFESLEIHGDPAPNLIEVIQARRNETTGMALVFPPKSAGTFLRTALIQYTNAELFRLCHAQGGRDMEPYFPTLLARFCIPGNTSDSICHPHMKGFHANIRMLELFDLKPVIMRRNIPDMLVSYFDMLAKEGEWADGFNESFFCGIPNDPRLHEEGKDALINLFVYHQAPWYFQFYASWLRAEREYQLPIKWIDYDDLAAGKDVEMLAEILAFYGYDADMERIDKICTSLKTKKDQVRINKGTGGRGQAFFTAEHHAHFERLASVYPWIDFKELGLL